MDDLSDLISPDAALIGVAVPNKKALLAAGMLVSALIRRAEEKGGSGMVLARGDATAGALLIQLAERGRPGLLLERRLDAAGDYRWSPTGPDADSDRADYIARRRR